MDILSAIIYIILFLVLMIFVFSMGLLTPIIGKKDIISVLVIGFVVGLVGGVFFVSPIYQDIPYVAGSIQEVINGDNETIEVEVSPVFNQTKIVSELKQKEGVMSVSNKGVVLQTDPFSDERKAIIEEKIPYIDNNFNKFLVDKKGIMAINFTQGLDPNQAINTLKEWLMYSSEINVKYGLINMNINVKSYNVDEVTKYLNSENIVVKSVEGPVHNAINDTKNSMLDSNSIIFLSGIIGLIVALISIFLDKITATIRKFIIKIRNR
ncbi:hypothetical protein ALNOE001_17350 [Candidatus Methanobinarius endosymbioticus]|uniref:Uncharacterized protein n=1 Tax=Candidatus Methanobinarius endosymbioticus TaxID=2006182 RepID=A0A366MAG0_9EURY|nr:hypothetical protein ALNOE001_17350 [Candidatus Methanobinarius endosymbioticus]